MKSSIVTSMIGCFGIGKDNKIEAFVKFPKDPNEIAEKINASKETMIAEEKKVKKILEGKGYKNIEKSGNDFVENNLAKLALERGFVSSRAEFNKLISKVNIALTKKEIKKAVGRDKLIVQANSALEEIDKSLNIFMERLREWYGLHFPEMDDIVEDHEKFAGIVEDFGLRKNIEHPELALVKGKSMGRELGEEDVEVIQDFADRILKLYELREKLSKYIEEVLSDIAPNLTELAGSTLAAKLIDLAGGLKKLARMPSSTIQLLGAEKALFRHLHGKGKSPKHGVIVMHPYVQKVPDSDKGKVARLLASKFAIAAKMDFYSEKDKGKKLKKELDEKFKSILKSK